MIELNRELILQFRLLSFLQGRLMLPHEFRVNSLITWILCFLQLKSLNMFNNCHTQSSIFKFLQTLFLHWLTYLEEFPQRLVLHLDHPIKLTLAVLSHLKPYWLHILMNLEFRLRLLFKRNLLKISNQLHFYQY